MDGTTTNSSSELRIVTEVGGVCEIWSCSAAAVGCCSVAPSPRKAAAAGWVHSVSNSDAAGSTLTLTTCLLICPNQFTAVVGTFNCQGGGWSREERRNMCASEHSKAVSSITGPSDIEWKQGHSPIPIEGVQTFAMYLFHEKELILSKPTDTIDITLEPFHFELITVSPVKVLKNTSIQFAPIGLVNMLNTGGAIESVVYNERGDGVRF
ncbi:hypothetical protein CASFOL_033113 [Castilleja foliolosa]|uniref:Sushi domain-containing protein n=1 Tax=Castilleja foliolosa TaxID=1961234 RepID=A0ABD3C417_9LAMI